MPKEKKRKSGKYCVAAGCTSTHVDGISLHEFPNEKRGDIRRRWVNFVKIKRKNFTQPTPYSVLCEKHFTADSYPQEYEYKKSFGIPVTKKCLLPHAVPTIHAESLSSPPVPQDRHVVQHQPTWTRVQVHPYQSHQKHLELGRLFGKESA